MAVITVNQIIDNIDSFISNVRNLSKSYYMVIGKPDAWDIDAAPPEANSSIQQTELSLYQDLVYGKIIDSEDISYMIRKIPWVSDTVYDQYDKNDPDLLTKDFYVVNDIGEGYKCINNGNGAPSTIKPFLSTEYGTFTTGDGYIWKFMYKVDSGANTKFASNTYIPVTVNANVESNAVPGTIDYINLTDSGTNYQVYEEGFLDSVVNTYVVQLPDTSSTYDNFYTGSSIYLKAGGGAGQIRPIVSYTGLDKSLTVDPPFDLFVNLKLANISGSITVGNKVSQNLVRMSYLYSVGSFDVGHTVVQTDTGATGVITSANSSVFLIQPSAGSADFSQNLPIYSTSNNHTAKGATVVSIVAGNNRVTRVTATNLGTLYSANDYIRVGNTSSDQVRRVISVNATVIICDANTPFTKNLSANTFEVNIAAAPVSIVQLQREGNIVYTNLTGQSLAISNTTPSGVGFTPGEKVNLVNASNVNQGANAIMSFSNTSTMFLTDAVGTFTSALYVLGASSNTRAYINSVVSYPNITVENPIGTFSTGQPISITTGAGSLVGNATVLAKLTTPNELTEYIISPTVTIDGDGNNAVAYAYIDESGNNINRQISQIITINPGEGYSRANVSISSNTLYGSGATAEVAVSPIAGHGANAHQELGARYAGISTTFGDGAAEGYKFPLYGSYRRIGILEDPKFNDAWVTVGSFDRTTIGFSNKDGNDFEIGEIIIQPASNAAGVVTAVNTSSSTVELKNVRSTFNANTRNMTFTVNTVSGVFSNGETIYQANSTPSNLAFGTIISENSSLGIMSVNLVNGAFSTFHTIVGTTSGANCSVEAIVYHDSIHGLVSNGTANVATANVNYFRIVEDNQQVYQLSSNSTGDLNQVVSNTLIRLTDVKGHFNANDTLIDATTNSYANVVSISIANGTVDATTDFGHKFTQTTRLTMLTNTAPYTPFERVYQEVSNASGQVISTTSDIDLVLTSTNGTFSVGNALTSGAGATALVVWANNDYGTNSSYLRCSSVTGNFDVGNTVINNLSVGGIVGAQYHTLVVSDIYGQFEADEDVIGVDSEAQGNVSVVLYPELVKNSGQLIYTDNIVPFTRSNTSVEKINIIIKF